MVFSRKLAPSFLLLFTGITSNSAQVADVFEMPFPRQYHVIDSIIDDFVHLDTMMASKNLEQMRLAAIETGDALTLLNFEQSVIRYRYIRLYYSQDSMAIKKLIKDALKLLETVDEKKYPVIAALIHKTLGNTIEYNSYKYHDAFHHYLKAYNLFKDISIQEFPVRQYSQYSIALAYYQFKDYENALKLGEEIETIYPQKNFISVFTINLIGMSYLKLGQYGAGLLFNGRL